MKKTLLAAAILSLASFAVMAQTSDTNDITKPVHKVKRHPIKSRLHKIGTVLKEPHAPSAPAQPKP